MPSGQFGDDAQLPCVNALVSDTVHGDVPLFGLTTEMDTKRILFLKLRFGHVSEMLQGDEMTLFLKVKEFFERNVERSFLSITANFKFGQPIDFQPFMALGTKHQKVFSPHQVSDQPIR